MSDTKGTAIMELPSYNLKLALKATLIVSFFVVSTLVLINQFFLERFADIKIKQVQVIGKATARLVTGLALEDIRRGSPDSLKKTLEDINQEIIKSNHGLLQISVILRSNGTYYSSTNQAFHGKKVHPSLYKKIQKNKQWSTVVQKLQYKQKQQIVPVLQFLQNIPDPQNLKGPPVATTHILFDYSQVLNSTRWELLIIGALILLVALVAIWWLLIPVSLFHRALAQGLLQIGQNKSSVHLPERFSNDFGPLYRVFHHLNHTLKAQSSRKALNAVAELGDNKQPALTADTARRKIHATCLCARIPGIYGKIKSSVPDEVFRFVDEYLASFHKTIQEHGGQLVRVQGDKIFCLFEGVNAVDNAIRASLKSNHIWRDINHERMVLNQSILEFGIGLHTAPAVLGTFKKVLGEYSILGEAPDTAAYLCSNAGTEEILISLPMIEQAKGSFSSQPLISFNSKSIAEKLEIFVLQNLPRGREANQIPEEGKALAGTDNVEPASIPNMLEETYEFSPLEAVDDQFEVFIEELPPLKEFPPSISGELEEEKPKVEQEESSMWDQFSISSSSGKK
ncbi:MAG: hypothetical protein COB67_11440 [SAR324 cluster bacterium]|uniref:Guanylate cyclase domain-containing protein n=1 Tax=SAR324 cluster bacterium TaxID=2024889 RepID=A0A2A4SU65_9DELT|nr:MAG: hypothetical protein COB67_11440 [SAR324 cluster bacterium]